MISPSERVEALVQQALPRLRAIVEERTSRSFGAHVVITRTDEDQVLFDRPIGDHRQYPESAGRIARYNSFIAQRPQHPGHPKTTGPDVFWRGSVRIRGPFLVSVYGTDVFDERCAEIIAEMIETEKQYEGVQPAKAG